MKMAICYGCEDNITCFIDAILPIGGAMVSRDINGYYAIITKTKEHTVDYGTALASEEYVMVCQP